MHKSHPFKAQDNIYLAIFKKPMSQVQGKAIPMSQVHGKAILSMGGFNSIIKAQDLNLWRIYFINGIQIHNQSPWFKFMAIYLSKPQFSLAISKSSIFIGNIKSSVLAGNIKSSVLAGNIKSSILIGNIKNPVLTSNIWML